MRLPLLIASCALVGASCDRITRVETIFDVVQPVDVACLTDVLAELESSGYFTQLREVQSPGTAQELSFVGPEVAVNVVLTAEPAPVLSLYYGWKGREPDRIELRHAEALRLLTASIRRVCPAAAGMVMVRDTCTASVCPDDGGTDWQR